ncbi:hypothetical protein BHE74_00036014 [Ensete ventricosum]|nr:hypothetical protein BHE74_00036014 [Ensete ventricosum]
MLSPRRHTLSDPGQLRHGLGLATLMMAIQGPHDELSQLDQLQDYGKGLGPQVPGSRVGLESATFSHLKVVRECKAKAFLPRRLFLLAIGRQTAPFPSVHVQRWSNDRISRRWRRWRCGWPCND